MLKTPLFFFLIPENLYSSVKKSCSSSNVDNLYSSVKKTQTKSTSEAQLDQNSSISKSESTKFSSEAVSGSNPEPADGDYDSDTELVLDPGYAECVDAIKGKGFRVLWGHLLW